MLPYIQHPHYRPLLKGKGKIWRIQVEQRIPSLLVECRDAQTLRVSFSAYHLEQRAWIWQDMEFEEGWWLTLAAAGEGMAFFTKVSDEPQQQALGITALDIAAQQVAWFYPDCQLQHVTADGVVVAKELDEAWELSVLDPKTGKQKAETSKKGPQDPIFEIPFEYETGSPFFETVAGYLSKHFSVSPQKVLYYWQGKNHIIVSFYVVNGDHLTEYLLIMDENGQPLHTTCLAENLKGRGSEPFMLIGNELFYIAEDELAVVSFIGTKDIGY